MKIFFCALFRFTEPQIDTQKCVLRFTTFFNCSILYNFKFWRDVSFDNSFIKISVSILISWTFYIIDQKFLNKEFQDENGTDFFFFSFLTKDFMYCWESWVVIHLPNWNFVRLLDLSVEIFHLYIYLLSFTFLLIVLNSNFWLLWLTTAYESPRPRV